MFLYNNCVRALSAFSSLTAPIGAEEILKLKELEGELGEFLVAFVMTMNIKKPSYYY